MATQSQLLVDEVLRNPDRDLLQRIRDTKWTSHNIPLTPSESTLGSSAPLIADDRRTVVIKSLIRRSFPSERPLRILDLGSLEGGLSFEMAREGWETIGIEARRENFEKAELIREYFGLPGLTFSMRDVKELDATTDGLFDVIVCCGLLYHLDEPLEFLATLASMTKPDGLLFLDTHVAPDERAAAEGTWTGCLSEPVSVTWRERAYDGCWFEEPQEGTALDAVWSAVSNHRSFWPTRRSLIRATYHAGFHSLQELYGAFEIDTEFALRDQFSRLYLACRKIW